MEFHAECIDATRRRACQHRLKLPRFRFCCHHIGSRDQTVRIWSLHREAVDGTGQLKLSVAATLPAQDSAVTAVAFAPRRVSVPQLGGAEAYLLAIGAENGHISFWASIDAVAWTLLPGLSVAGVIGHNGTVTKLAWRPVGADNITLQLASASTDMSTRLWRLGPFQ